MYTVNFSTIVHQASLGANGLVAQVQGNAVDVLLGSVAGNLTINQNVVAEALTLTSPVMLSALRCVTTNNLGQAIYADPDTLGTAAVLGITIDAGTTVQAQYDGMMTDAGWTWVQGLIWCGANGVLTQTPPVTGALVQVARAITATTILVNIENPIIRN